MMSINSNENLKHFILIVFIPLLAILLMFTYAFLYVKDEAKFVEHELEGLNRIHKVQDMVFKIQKLRGLSNIIHKDEECLTNIESLNKIIKNDVISFQNDVKTLEEGKHLKKQFEIFLNTTLHHTTDNNDFNHLSETIHDARILIENISYHSKLALDSILQSYVLSQTIVLTLPELIEYNGQIRGISSSINNNQLTIEQKSIIVILQSKIKDKIKQLKFNMNELNSKDLDIIKTIYLNTITAQNSVPSKKMWVIHHLNLPEFIINQ